jgi:hypothetical protein
MATVVRAFSYTGNIQPWVVPTGVTSVRFELWGATGGGISTTARTYPQHNDEMTAASYAAQGAPTAFASIDIGSNPGGYVSGDRTVTPGDTYNLVVGGNGQNGYTGTALTAAGGYNSGGAGGAGRAFGSFNGQSGGGGGGGTDVRYGGNTISNRICAAGGAGGNAGGALDNQAGVPRAGWAALPTAPVPPYGAASYAQAASVGYEHFQQNYVRVNYYGVGGSALQAGGSGWWGSAAYNSAGGAGAVGAGGAGGAAHSGGGTGGGAGTFGIGGGGGAGSATAVTSLSAPVQGGGGGGGGYYGGGGGGTGGQNGGWYPAGGGGGGSNYTGGFTTTVANIASARPPHPTALHNAGALSPYINATPGGLIRLTYDVLPTMTLNTPRAGAPIASNKPTVVSMTWTHYDGIRADGALFAKCAGADVRWSVASANTWTQVHVDAPVTTDADYSVDMTYTIPSGTFTAGTNYDIQVRGYDTSGDVSGWTSITVKALAAPSAPVFTNPSAGANVATPFNITWTNPNSLPEGNEVLYRCVLTSSGHTVDSGVLNSGIRVNYATQPDIRSSISGFATVNAPDTIVLDSTIADPWGVNGVGKVTWGSGGSGIMLLGIASRPAGQQVTLSIYIKSATTGAPAMEFLVKDGFPGNELARGVPLPATTGWVRTSLTYISSGTDWVYLVTDTAATAGTISYFSSFLEEDEDTLMPYFGKVSKDPALTGTLATSSAGYAYYSGTQTLSYTVDTNVWPFGPAPVTATLYISTIGSQGFFSDPVSRSFVINTNPPGTPTVAMTVDHTAGTVTLDATAVNTPNTTLYMDVFRAEVANPSGEIRIAAGLLPNAAGHVVFTDYGGADATAYQYRVRAYSAAGGFADAT